MAKITAFLLAFAISGCGEETDVDVCLDPAGVVDIRLWWGASTCPDPGAERVVLALVERGDGLWASLEPDADLSPAQAQATGDTCFVVTEVSEQQGDIIGTYALQMEITDQVVVGEGLFTITHRVQTGVICEAEFILEGSLSY